MVPLFCRLPHRHPKYMDEHIADNFKREAMKNPFLRELLRTDSIYIRSNITFDNLAPLSTYLGKPGNPGQGRHSLCRIQAPPGRTPRSGNPLAAGCAGFHPPRPRRLPV
jgi:hypothetical protein